MTIQALWRALTALLALLACVYVGGTLIDHYQDLKTFSWSGAQWLLIGMCSLIWVAVLILSGITWAWLLEAAGQKNDCWSSVAIFGISQLGKYLPGNFAHHVGRFAMARGKEMSVVAISHSMFFEVVLSFLVAVCFFLLGVFLFDLGMWRELIQLKNPSRILIYFLAGIMVSLALFKDRLRIWAKDYLAAGSLLMPSWRPILKSMVVFSASYLALGCVIDLHARFLFDFESSHWLWLSTVFSGAWVVGALMPGAPAGLGVREVVLIATLTPVYGETVAIGLSMTLRIITVSGDCLNFLIWCLLRSLKHGKI